MSVAYIKTGVEPEINLYNCGAQSAVDDSILPVCKDVAAFTNGVLKIGFAECTSVQENSVNIPVLQVAAHPQATMAIVESVLHTFGEQVHVVLSSSFCMKTDQLQKYTSLDMPTKAMLVLLQNFRALFQVCSCTGVLLQDPSTGHKVELDTHGIITMTGNNGALNRLLCDYEIPRDDALTFINEITHVHTETDPHYVSFDKLLCEMGL